MSERKPRRPIPIPPKRTFSTDLGAPLQRGEALNRTHSLPIYSDPVVNKTDNDPVVEEWTEELDREFKSEKEKAKKKELDKEEA